MRDAHFGVHPAFGYIWLLTNFYDYLITNRTGTYSAYEHHENRHATLEISMEMKLSFPEKQNRRMIIGLFVEIIKLNENKKSDFKRVKN